MIFYSQLCSQSPYVFHSILVSKLSKNAFSMLPISFVNPILHQPKVDPSGWNCINHIYGVQVGGQSTSGGTIPVWSIFSWSPEASPVSDGIAITLSVESHANCSSLPNPPTPPFFHALLDFAFLVLMVEVILWITTSWELYLWTIHFQYTILLLS